MNEKRLETFASILRGIQTLAMIYALGVGILWYVKGRIWFKETILPFHELVFYTLLTLTLLILIPLLVMKITRPYSGHMLYQFAYFFAASPGFIRRTIV